MLASIDTFQSFGNCERKSEIQRKCRVCVRNSSVCDTARMCACTLSICKVYDFDHECVFLLTAYRSILHDISLYTHVCLYVMLLMASCLRSAFPKIHNFLVICIARRIVEPPSPLLLPFHYCMIFATGFNCAKRNGEESCSFPKRWDR